MYADSLKRILKRTDERRGCIVGWLTFWNPKNLQKKVDMYGYHFSWKTHAVMIFLALAGVIAIGAMFRLKARCDRADRGYHDASGSGAGYVP